MGDITTTGPVGLKGLTGLSTNNTPDFGLNYKLLSPEETARPYRSPIEVANEAANDNLQSQYDEQMIDTGVTRAKGERTVWDQPEIDDIQNYRAYRQSAVNKLANGAAKAGVLTATTFLNDTIGAVAGLVGMVDGDDETNYWDNPFSRAMKSVNDWSERALPNFYSTEEQEHPFKITANFIGDKVIKNLGFTAGSMLAAGAVGNGVAGAIGGVAERMTANALNKAVATAGKAAKNTTKAARELQKATNFTKLEKLIGANQQIPKLITTGTAALYGAIGEGAFEALNNSDEWLKAEMAKYDNEFTNKENAIVAKYQANKGKGFALNPETGSAIDPAYLEYKHDMENLAAEREQAQQLAKDRARRMGNIDMALNTIILTASNIVQFGKQLSGGFRNSAAKVGQNAGRFAGMDIETAINTAKKEGMDAKTFLKEYAKFNPASTKTNKVIDAVKNSMMEGVEEISQSAASSASGIFEEKRLDREFEYLEAGRDPKLANEQASWFADFASSLLEGAGETLKSKEAWSEFFVGALTGALGAPAIGAGASNAAIHTTIGANEEKGRKGLTIGWGGGIYGGIKEGMDELAEEQEIANKANEIIQSPTFQAIYSGKIRHDFYDMKKQEAALDNDEVAYEMADAKQMAADIAMADKAGQLGVMEAAIEHLYDTTPENIQAFREQFAEQMTDAAGHQLSDEEIAKEMEEQKHNAMNTIKEFKISSNLVETIAAKHGVELDDETLENLTWQRAAARQYMDRANQHGLKLGSAIKDAHTALQGILKSYADYQKTFPGITDEKDDEFGKLTVDDQNALRMAWNAQSFNEGLASLMSIANNESSTGLGDIAANNVLWQVYKPMIDNIVETAKNLGQPINGAEEQLDVIKQLADKSVEWQKAFDKKTASAKSLKKEVQKTQERAEVQQQEQQVDADQNAIKALNNAFQHIDENTTGEEIKNIAQANAQSLEKVGKLKAYIRNHAKGKVKDRLVDYVRRATIGSKINNISISRDSNATQEAIEIAGRIQEDIANAIPNGQIDVADINSYITKRLGEQVASQKAKSEATKILNDIFTKDFISELSAVDGNKEVGSTFVPTTVAPQQSSAETQVRSNDEIAVSLGDDIDGDIPVDGEIAEGPIVGNDTEVTLGEDIFNKGPQASPAKPARQSGGQAKRDDAKDDLNVQTALERYNEMAQLINGSDTKLNLADKNAVLDAFAFEYAKTIDDKPVDDTANNWIRATIAKALSDGRSPVNIMSDLQDKGFKVIHTIGALYFIDQAMLKTRNDDAKRAVYADAIADALTGNTDKLAALYDNRQAPADQDALAAAQAQDNAIDAALVAATDVLPSLQNSSDTTPAERTEQQTYEPRASFTGLKPEHGIYAFYQHNKTLYSEYLEQTGRYPNGPYESTEAKAAYLEYIKALEKFYKDNNVEANINALNNECKDGKQPLLSVKKETIGKEDVPVIYDGDKVVGVLPIRSELKILQNTTDDLGNTVSSTREDTKLAKLVEDVLNGNERTIQYGNGMGGEYFTGNERTVNTLTNGKDFEITIASVDSGNNWSSADNPPAVSNRVPGRIFVTVTSSNGRKHPAMAKMMPISSVGNDYFEPFFKGLADLMKDKRFIRGHYMNNDARTPLEAKTLGALRDVVQSLGINGTVSFGLMSRNGQYHDMVTWNGRDGGKRTSADATTIGIVYRGEDGSKVTLPIRLNRDNKAGEIDQAYMIEQIKASPLAQKWANVSLGRLNDPAYRQMISQYMTTNVQSLETINDWFTVTIPDDRAIGEPAPVDDISNIQEKPDAMDHNKPAIKVIGTSNNAGINKFRKVLGKAKSKDNDSIDDDDTYNLRADKVYGSTAMTNEERLAQSIARVKRMFPSLSDEHIKIIHDGLIRSVDHNDNPVEAYGRFKNGIIEVCRNSPVGTVYHEAFHYVTSTLMDPFTYNDMMALGVQRYGITNPMEVEEHLAEDFRDFMNGYDDTSLRGRLRSLFTNLKIMVKSLFSNRMSLDKMFYDIMRGQMNYYNGNMSAKVYQEEYDRAREITNLDNYEQMIPMLDVNGSFAHDLAIALADISHSDEMAVGIERLMVSGQLFTRYDINLSLVHCMAFNLTEGYSESLFESKDHLNLPNEKHKAYQKAVRDRLNQYFDAHIDAYHAAQRLSSLTTAQRYLLAEHANNAMLGKNAYRYIAERYGMKPYVYYGVNDAIKSLFNNNEAYKSADQIYGKVNKLIDISSKLGTKVAFAPSYMDHTLEGMTTSTTNPLVIIYIDPSMNDGAIARAAIHELTHSITNTALEILDNDKLSDEQKLERFGEAGISYDQIDAIEDLYDLFVDMNDTYDESTEIPYGMTSIQEFVSELTSGEGKGQFRETVQERMANDPSFLSDAMDAVERFIDGHTQNSINNERKYNVKFNDALNKHYSLAFNKYRQRKIDDILNSADGNDWMKRMNTTAEEIRQLPLEMQEDLTFCM